MLKSKYSINMKKILVSALLVGAGAIGWWIYYDASQPGKYDAFAKCLEEKEVLFKLSKRYYKQRIKEALGMDSESKEEI